MKHISIDLETLGTSADAAITQIGYAMFEIATGEITHSGNILVKPDSGKIDPSTIAWWLKQTDAARGGMVTAIENGAVGVVGLLELRDACIKHAAHDFYVWGNGATFDISILESAFARSYVEPPWKFYNIRDMRTIVHAAEELAGFAKHIVPREGVHHNAKDDAIHQAKIISAAWRALSKGA